MVVQGLREFHPMAVGRDKRQRAKAPPELWGVVPSSFNPDERMVLPSCFRKVLEEAGVGTLIVTRAPLEAALVLCPQASWRLLMRFVRSCVPQAPTYEGHRFVLAYRWTVRWDAKGRFLLAQDLAHYADLKSLSPVLFVGTGPWVELWKAERYRERKEQWDKSFP